MFKKTLFQIHWFLGISAGLILSIMGVTGAIYSYEQPIQKWLNQESYTVKAEQKEKLTPAQIYQHFQQTDPSIKINSITIDHDPAASSSVNIVKEGARKGYNMMINPYSAEILPEVKGREFFQFIQQLHRKANQDKRQDSGGVVTNPKAFAVLHAPIFLRRRAVF